MLLRHGCFSRKIVGWSTDSALVVNALDLAIRNRQPVAGGIVHADHGVQFTSWSFGEKVRSAGLMPSFWPGRRRAGQHHDRIVLSSMQTGLSTASDGTPRGTRERDPQGNRAVPQAKAMIRRAGDPDCLQSLASGEIPPILTRSPTRRSARRS